MADSKKTAKDFSYLKKLKTKNSKSTLWHNNIAEPVNKKDKQKRLKYWHQHIKEQNKTSVIGNNIIDIIQMKKKYNINNVTNFNCNKNSYYANNCTKPKT